MHGIKDGLVLMIAFWLQWIFQYWRWREVLLCFFCQWYAQYSTLCIFLKSMSDLHMYLIDITLFSDSNFLKYKWFASVIDVLSIYTTSYFRICLCVYLYHVCITPFFCCTLFKQAWFMLSPLPTLLSHIMPLWSPFEVLRTNLATQQELA